MDKRKYIEVVAAIICDGDRVFATQRGYGEWKDWWEFPGGKMEPGETPEAALCREIREELATRISVGELLTTVEYDYPKFHLTMHCYLGEVVACRRTGDRTAESEGCGGRDEMKYSESELGGKSL